MRRYRIWYGAAMVAALLIYIISNRSEALTVLLCLVVVPVLSFVIELVSLNGFKMEYSVKSSCHVGQEIPLEIRISKKNRGPLGRVQLKIQIKNTMYGEEKTQTVILCASEKKNAQFQHLIKMENCGCVRITVLHVKCYDHLGIFCWTRPGASQREVLVYPAQLQLNTQLLRRPETIISGELYDQNRKGQDVSEVSGLREYEKGDSLGSIHWKLSSKIDTLVVREFGYPANYNILVLYNVMAIFGENEISNQRNDAVLAFTSALSRSMVERNLEHNVGCAAGELQDFPVYSLATCEQMVLNLLCRPVHEKNGRDSLYRFLQTDIRRKYTKIIYITPEYEESAARQLSRELDLTIIQVNQGDGKEYMATEGYSVIPVDAETYQKKAYNIVI